jgi:RNA polymerase sigma-70 factor (ECF subfamily)
VYGAALERVFRTAGGPIIARLAVRFRDLSLAEDSFSGGCLKALETWPDRGVPRNPTAWLYRVAERLALDALRRQRVRDREIPDEPPPEPSAEELLMDDGMIIPDERLRLIFICCHPAVAPDARAALTLRLVCGLSLTEIARAFLLKEATLAQRLVRAKRKISEAGVPFELPARELWPERLEAVLSTVEVAYSKAHEDAACRGAHGAFAAEVLGLTRLLCDLLPGSGEVRALAALIRYAEARRPARVDADGCMVPLADQDPLLWRRDLIGEADDLLRTATHPPPADPRRLQAELQRLWCARRDLEEPAPWPSILRLYDRLLELRDDPIVRINRAVALAETSRAEEALREIDTLSSPCLEKFLPYQAVRADLLRRTGQREKARTAYAIALSLDPGTAEKKWLERKLAEL